MSIWRAVVLGLVQGLTEFLPVSSTAHLRVVPALLGWGDPGAAFSAVTQLGTVAAVLAVFRADLWRIAVATLRSVRDRRPTPEARQGWAITLGTIPIGLAGLAFQQQIEQGARSLVLIGAALIVVGVALGAADRRWRDGRRPLADVRLPDGVVVGLAQTLALVPGVSRSGATLIAGLGRGFGRADAARFSFLLSVPAVVLSGLFQLPDAIGPNDIGLVPTAAATLAAFVAGYASITGFLRYLTRHSLDVFVAYRILLGVTVIALATTGTIT